VEDGSIDLADDPWATRNLENRNFTYVIYDLCLCYAQWKQESGILAPIPTACEHVFHILGTFSEKNIIKKNVY
jgi:hypothetical protein